MTDDAAEPAAPQEELDLNFHTDIPVGEILRRTRTHYGQTLPQIETVLRIRASQLEALEQGDIAKLPGRVYAIGFVRSYSEYLGLDGDKMVQLFKDQSVGRQKKPDLSFAAPAAESKAPGKAVIAAGVGGAILLVILLKMFVFTPRETAEIPPVPEELSRAQLNQAPALIGTDDPALAGAAPSAAAPADAGLAPSAAPAADAAPAAPESRIALEITDSAWVEIRNARGEVLLQRVLKPGDKFLVPDEEGLVMATGNAGGIRVRIDGREVASRLGDIGQIKRNVLLDPAAFGVSP